MACTLIARYSITAPILLAAVLLGCVQSVMAEALQDPTRPPTATSLPPGDSAAPLASGPQLQSIRIGGLRPSAIISGQRVSLGERYEGAQVVEISENQVVLKGSSGIQTLALFPAIGKSAVMRRQVVGHQPSRRSQ